MAKDVAGATKQEVVPLAEFLEGDLDEQVERVRRALALFSGCRVPVHVSELLSLICPAFRHTDAGKRRP